MTTNYISPSAGIEQEVESEFGKGFIYNLILFAAHFERAFNRGIKPLDMKYYQYGLWFNGASDHLYELEIPEKWDNHEIGIKAKELRELALEIGHGRRMTEDSPQIEKDYWRCVGLTKEIGLLIDKELGHEPIEAQYD